MSHQLATADQTALILADPGPLDRNPAAVYLAGLQPTGTERRPRRSQLSRGCWVPPMRSVWIGPRCASSTRPRSARGWRTPTSRPLLTRCYQRSARCSKPPGASAR
jgi:hypothetical protein